MKKILLLIALLFTIKAFSQVNLIDYTTVQPAAPYTNVLTMTIPGVATNVQVTIITTNSAVGDSLASAAAKINGDFQFVTNGNVTAGGVLQGLATNASFSATGILTINGYGSTLTSSNATVTITRSYSNNRTNYDLSVTGGAGGSGILTLNGIGTNTTLQTAINIGVTNITIFGTAFLNDSNMMISYVSNSIIVATNSLIPSMSSNTCSVGDAAASSLCTSVGVQVQVWGAFTTNKYFGLDAYNWAPANSSGAPQNIVFHFTNAVTTSMSSYAWYVGGDGHMALSNSVDAVNWYLDAYVTNISGVTNYITFPTVTANYFKWTLIGGNSPGGGGGYGCGDYLQHIQLYNLTYTNTANYNLISNNNQLVITAPGGVGINNSPSGYDLNIAGGHGVNDDLGYFVNGVPIGQISGTTNSNPTNPTNGVPGLTFDPATTGYFSNCDSSITTNFNGYAVSSFYSTLPNYYQYNPLPPGAYFTVIPTGHQYVQPSSGAIFNSYQYTLYSPNFNTTKTVFQTPLQSLTAVNNLVLNLKAAGLWNLFTNYALYPFASTHSDCNAVNLMGTNYTIGWNGFLATSTAHGTWGVSNGISSLGYGDTGFKITNSAWTNLTLVAFVESSGSATNYLLSSFDLTNRADLWTIGMTNLMSTLNTTNDAANSFDWDTNGTFFSVTRQLPSVENGLIDFTNFYSRTANTNSEPSSNIVLFAQSAGFNESSNLVLGFAAILPGLTTNQLATLQNIVIQYEVAMGRYPQANTSYSTNTLPTSVLAGTTVTSTGSALIVVPSQNANGTTNFDLGATWRAGEVTVGSSGTSTSVTFSSPFPTSVGTNYSLTFGTGSGFATFPNPEWSTKTTNGFTLITTAVVGGGIEDYTAMANQ